MQFKSIILSLVASAAIAQAVEYATYDVCKNEISAVWNNGYDTITDGIDTINAIRCSFCLWYIGELCGPRVVCDAGTPEVAINKCHIDTMAECKILAFKSYYPSAVSGTPV